MPEQHRAQLNNNSGQIVVTILQLGGKPADMKYPLRRNDPVLGEVPTQGVDRLRPLPDQQVRVLNIIPEACFSALLTATKRIVGRAAASQPEMGSNSLWILCLRS